MTIFVDTSALLAVLDADDSNHMKARKVWEDLINREEQLFSTNYVLVETIALVQHRLGIKALQTLQADILPMFRLEWVNEEIHRAGVAALLAAGRKKLTLVDLVSFNVMQRLGLQTAFAFDHHFSEQGFACLP